MTPRSLNTILFFLLLSPTFAQMQEGSIYTATHFSIRTQDKNFGNALEWSISPQAGYYIKDMWSIGLIGQAGFQHIDSYSSNTAVGTESKSSKEGTWGGLGPVTRIHIGSEKASAIGEFGFQFGWFRQTSETSETQDDGSYYLQKGNYMQLSMGPGFAYYFNPRIGAEFVVTYFWNNVKRKSGNVYADGELEDYNQQTLNYDGFEWKIGLVAFFGNGAPKEVHSE